MLYQDILNSNQVTFDKQDNASKTYGQGNRNNHPSVMDHREVSW